MIIAVTGIMGSGKSTVARNLVRILGAEHCDTDLVCRDLLEHNGSGWRGVAELWGTRFFNESMEIDRVLLRKSIFEHSEMRSQLEGILHPLVRKHVSSLMERCRRNVVHCVVEVPLLFEVGWQDDFDNTIVVFAENEICLQRIMTRDSVSREEAEKSLAIQMPISEKMKLADYVIDNSGDLQQTFDNVTNAVKEMAIM